MKVNEDIITGTTSGDYSYIPKTEYMFIQIINLDTSNRLSLNVKSNEYSQMNKLVIKPENTSNKYNFQQSCFLSHKDKHYLYGGSQDSRLVFELNCDQIEVHKRNLNFDFVGGRCASNNKYILLCFPKENKRLCYKSNKPDPTKWWEWFTYVDFAYASHDSIALSLGKRFDPIFTK